MDLFAPQEARHRAAAAPLAVRMRPQTLAEFVGHSHILGPGKLLRRMIEADRLGSIILHGPPGSGKTTLARLVAAHTAAAFVPLNATASGVKEVRAVLDDARDQLATRGRRTVLFLDEIHRFSRAQQDVLLSDVEDGVITLIGATTENPYFAVNAPLLSRSRLFALDKLSAEDLVAILRRALADAHRGLGRYALEAHDDALALIAEACEGDARSALTALEVAVLSQVGGAQPIVLDRAVAQESVQRKAMLYDRTGDDHYNLASAFQKSLRGSDPDAAIYWMARMLAAGEDIRFVARRLAVCAAEDVGNADPRATILAAAALQIAEFVGLPEARIPLAQAAIYVACAPKSAAANHAIAAAMADVTTQPHLAVPVHLRDTNTPAARQPGHPAYRNPHDHPAGHVDQDYLGAAKRFYCPTDRGYERQMAAYLAALGRLAT